jgi:hypothetical protein
VSSFACCYQGCSASICFEPEIEQRLRRTHEWWMCPFGHRQHFTDKTWEEQEIERLNRLVRSTESVRDRWRAHAEENESVFGTCPFCGWRTRSAIDNRWLYMLRHFSRIHGCSVEDFGPGTDPVYAMQEKRKEKASV